MPVTDEEEYISSVIMSDTQSTASKAEQRKSNKPIMEKRRRARINHCLNELKSLILNAMKKDPARHSKLEKADILEMTVKHLQTVQRQQLSAALASDPTVITKFRSGFDECAAEVSRYISRLDGVEHGVKQRLSAHLHRCVNSLQQMTPPNHPSSHDDNNNSNQRTVLIPSRLPTGQLALVLPESYSSAAFLPSGHNSAFTALKNQQAMFQPFKVDIPNSHLTAHISIPEPMEKNKNLSPKKSPSPAPVQRPQVSSSQGSESQSEPLHLPSLSDDDYPRIVMPERRPVVGQRVPHIKEPSPTPNRLHAALVNQKPNPNYHLNPRIPSANPLKFVRYGEARHRQSETLRGPSPAKLTRYSPNPESRSSVIVTDTKETATASSSRFVQENQASGKDNMWRPW